MREHPLVLPFAEAAALLGCDHWPSSEELRRAYRAAVRANPPDRDPDAFRRVRDAYELLREPLDRSLALLTSRVPLTAPPPIEARVPEQGELALALLRCIAARIDVASILAEDP
jgi:curved DNA-binding protein CbpA